MRILLISQHFPPLETARALQMGKVVEALKANGCCTTVIAGKINSDSSDIEVGDGVVYLPCWWRSYDRSLVRRASRRMIEELYSCSWPSSRWVQSAIDYATAVIAKYKPNCVMTSSTPFESHLVGLAVKRKTKTPWVASFSDPWPPCTAPRPHFSKGLPILRRRQLSLLAKVMRECDIIHMPSRYGIEQVERATGLRIDGKAVAIPHIGFPNERVDVAPEYAGWAAHVGDLKRARVSDALILGVQKAHAQIPHLFKGLICVGRVCPEFRQMVGRLQMDDIVRFTGQLPVDQAMRMARSATVLLLLEANMAISPYLPGKFADYAFLRKPILAVVPPVGAVRDYLETYGGGKAVEHDPDEIAEALVQMFSADGNGHELPVGYSMTLSNVFTLDAVGGQYRVMFNSISTIVTATDS